MTDNHYYYADENDMLSNHRIIMVTNIPRSRLFRANWEQCQKLARKLQILKDMKK
jgi:hypothetical protein